MTDESDYFITHRLAGINVDIDLTSYDPPPSDVKAASGTRSPPAQICTQITPPPYTTPTPVRYNCWPSLSSSPVVISSVTSTRAFVLQAIVPLPTRVAWPCGSQANKPRSYFIINPLLSLLFEHIDSSGRNTQWARPKVRAGVVSITTIVSFTQSVNVLTLAATESNIRLVAVGWRQGIQQTSTSSTHNLCLQN